MKWTAAIKWTKQKRTTSSMWKKTLWGIPLMWKEAEWTELSSCWPDLSLLLLFLSFLLIPPSFSFSVYLFFFVLLVSWRHHIIQDYKNEKIQSKVLKWARQNGYPLDKTFVQMLQRMDTLKYWSGPERMGVVLVRNGRLKRYPKWERLDGRSSTGWLKWFPLSILFISGI